MVEGLNIVYLAIIDYRLVSIAVVTVAVVMFVIVGVCLFSNPKVHQKREKMKKDQRVNLTVNPGPPTEKIWEEMKGTHVIHCQHQGQLYN